MLEAASQLERFHGRHSQFNQRGSVPKGAITQFRLLFTQPVFFSLIILYHLVEQIFHHRSLINPTNSRPNFFFFSWLFFASPEYTVRYTLFILPQMSISVCCLADELRTTVIRKHFLSKSLQHPLVSGLNGT